MADQPQNGLPPIREHPDATLQSHHHVLANGLDWTMVTGLRNRFYLKNFVETGTAGGVTARDAAALFRRVWSCEITPFLYKRAQHRCRGISGLTLLLGKSVELLPGICGEIAEEPTFFYLDAHWCGGGHPPDTDCPLLGELEIIRRLRPNCPDVIVIDNAGMILRPPTPPDRAEDWPTTEQVVSVLRHRQSASPFIALVVDQLIISPGPLFRNW